MTSISFDPKVMEWVKDCSNKRGMTVSGFLNQLLRRNMGIISALSHDPEFAGVENHATELMREAKREHDLALQRFNDHVKEQYINQKKQGLACSDPSFLATETAPKKFKLDDITVAHVKALFVEADKELHQKKLQKD